MSGILNSADSFAQALHTAGWVEPNDAQHTGVERLRLDIQAETGIRRARIGRLDAALRASREVAAAHQAATQRVLDERNNARERANAAEQRAAEAQSKLYDATTAISELTERLKQRERAIDALAQDNDRKRAAVQEKDTHHSELVDKIETLAEQHRELEERYHNSEINLTLARQDRTAADDAARKAEAEAKELRHQLERTKDTLSGVVNQRDWLAGKLTEADRTIEALHNTREAERRQMWRSAFNAIISRRDCPLLTKSDFEVPASLATAAVKEFDKKFPAPTKETRPT